MLQCLISVHAVHSACCDAVPMFSSVLMLMLTPLPAVVLICRRVTGSLAPAERQPHITAVLLAAGTGMPVHQLHAAPASSD
jgi:hypothetical protein